MTDRSKATEFVLYQTEDGHSRIQCRLQEETVWLTQAQIAELFQTTPQNVTQHIKAIFSERELLEEATCKQYLQVRREGSRDVTRKLRHYRLEVILAVGFRVRHFAEAVAKAKQIESTDRGPSSQGKKGQDDDR